MDALLATLRTMHFAAAISLFGIASFVVLIEGPALRRIDTGAVPRSADENGLPLARAARISLGLWFVSLLLWLLVEAAGMSGQTIADSLRHGTVITVLARTQSAITVNCASSPGFWPPPACAATHGVYPAAGRARAFFCSFLRRHVAPLAWIGHAGAMSGRRPD